MIKGAANKKAQKAQKEISSNHLSVFCASCASLWLKLVANALGGEGGGEFAREDEADSATQGGLFTQSRRKN